MLKHLSASMYNNRSYCRNGKYFAAKAGNNKQGLNAGDLAINNLRFQSR